ncbi:MAG: ankyrin repeat domain-containing protein [Wolbachia sp.]
MPLHITAFHGDTSKVKSLLNVKIDINIKSRDGFTALHMVAYSGHLDVVKLLINSGAGVDTRTVGGSTLLHSAVLGKNNTTIKAIVEELIKAGADSGTKDYTNGKTPYILLLKMD